MCVVIWPLDKREVEQLREERDRLLERPPRRLDRVFGYWIGFSVRFYYTNYYINFCIAVLLLVV